MASYNHSMVSLCPSGKYLAFFNHTGLLRIWETTSFTLHQEYTLDSRLSINPRCLVWCCTFKKKSPKKREQRSSSVHEERDIFDIIAFGTTSGNILLFSLHKKSIERKLIEGHDETVNDGSLHFESDSFFSCSDDQHVIHWNWSDGKVKYKWKGDRSSIHSVCALDATNVLSASSNIKWWDVEKRTLIKRFTGHGGDVFRLLPVIHNQNDTVEGSYFISAARTDNLISAWQLKTNKNNNALASFKLTDEPLSLDISKDTSEEKHLLTAVTKSGKLHIFKHQLNGICSRPLQPNVTINISSSQNGDSHESTLHVPVLSTHICGGHSVLLVYGTTHKPTFEVLSLDDSETQINLSRSVSSFSSSPIMVEKKNALELEGREVTPKHKFLPKSNAVLNNQKKETIHSPFSHKISNPNLTRAPILQIASYLQQGVETNNTEILDTVFHHCEDVDIKKVIVNFPNHAVLPLFKELHQRLHMNVEKSYTYLRWMKELLQVHTRCFIMSQDADDIFTYVANLLKTRNETFVKLSHLKGQLSLLLTQISSRSDDNKEIPKEALVSYKEESSDSEVSTNDDLEQNHSDSEDSWNDLSDEEGDDEESENIQTKRSRTRTRSEDG